MTLPFTPLQRTLLLCVAIGALSACAKQGNDWDLRTPVNGGLDTTPAVQNVVASRPQPDARGIISYPGYQVAISRQGDTVATVADRIGVNAGELARFNGVSPNQALRPGEVLALPGRVPDTMAGTAAANGQGGSGGIDITTLAESAINRASDGTQGSGQAATQGTGAGKAAAGIQPGQQPLRHRVQPGETAYSIARLYNVPVKALADWNGLNQDMDVHVGQILLIPVPANGKPPQPPRAAATTPPGQQSPVSEPPSASKPLPKPDSSAAAAAAKAPASPDLGQSRTAASAARFDMPVNGKIIRSFVKGKNDGIDISAPAGSPVHAADTGEVAAITKKVDGVPVMVVRHPGGLLTVYANIDNIKVKKGATVKRGEVIGAVHKGSPAFIHFEVRKGFNAVDPMDYLQ